MIDERVERWFAIVTEREVEQIQSLLMLNADFLEAKQPPLMHTSIFVVLKIKNEKKCVEILKVLLKMRVDVNAINIFGQTPLFYAISSQKILACRLLLQSGASLTIKDQFKLTPLQYATKLGYPKVVKEINIALKSLQTQSCQIEGTVPQRSKLRKQKYKVCELAQNGQIKPLPQQFYDNLTHQNSPFASLIQNNQDLDLKSVLPLGDTWQNIGLKILNRLQRMSESVWFKQCLFAQSDAETSSDSESTDLSVIKLKLKNQIYRDPRELRKDVNNIWRVCSNEFGGDHQLTRFALEISSQFERLARDFGFNGFIR